MSYQNPHDRLQCHQCAARFRDDNAFAEHVRRHRHPRELDHMTNERQARRAMIEDLKEILDATG